MKHTITELEWKAFCYRRRFLEIFTKIGFGHVTSAFSWADIATVIYNEIMDVAPTVREAPLHDRMVVSKGHGAGMLFPVFEDMGYFSKEQMEDMVRIGGISTELRKLFFPGFDFYGGSLGIGLGLAAGLAKGAKMNGKLWHVWCILGDAECYEGAVWEAVNFAGHCQLDNLVAVVDRNFLGCSDFTEHMLCLEPLKDKWESFGWDVEEVDGHDMLAIYNALNKAYCAGHAKPQCIIADTKKGKGLDYLIDKPLMHGYMPKGEDVDKAFRLLK